MPASAAPADLDAALAAAQLAVDDAYALHDASLTGDRTARVLSACEAASTAVARAEEKADGEIGEWDRLTLQARLLYLRGKAIASAE